MDFKIQNMALKAAYNWKETETISLPNFISFVAMESTEYFPVTAILVHVESGLEKLLYEILSVFNI